MFSNRYRFFSLILSLIFSTVFLSGCGIKFWEQNKDDQVVQVQSAKCLTPSIEYLKKYFTGTALDSEAQYSFDCLQAVFLAFKANIRGQSKDLYTPQELATFVEKNFFTSETFFSDEFLSELMFLKVALVGGSVDAVRKSEVDLVVDLLKDITPELISLNKYMHILTYNWNVENLSTEEDKEKKFLDAKKALKSTILKLTIHFEEVGRTYDIDHLISFIKETARFVDSEAGTIKKIEQARPVIKKFKFLLIGGQSNLQGAEWSRLGLTLNEVLFQSLRYEYFIKKLTNVDVDDRWLNYKKMTIDIAQLIETLLDNRATKSITNNELAELFNDLGQLLPQMSMDVKLLNQIGDLKFSLLGDSPSKNQGWSDSDFSKLQIKLPILFDSISRIEKILMVLEKKGLTERKVNEYEFENLEKDLLQEIAVIRNLFVGPYNLKSLKDLIEGLAKGPLKDIFELPANFDKLFEVALVSKEALTGYKGPQLRIKDLKVLIDTTARLYLNYVEYELYAKPYKFHQKGFVNSVSRVWIKAVKTVDAVLIQRDSKTIMTSEITSIILKLQQTGFLKTKLNSDTLKTTLNALWTNLLNDPQVRLSGHGQNGLNKVTLNRLVNESDMLLKTQNHLVKMFGQQTRLNRQDVVQSMTARMSLTKDKNEQVGLSEMIFLNGKSIPLNFDQQNDFLQIGLRNKPTYSYYDLTLSNLFRAVGRLLITSYANDYERVRRKVGVTESELEKTFQQFKPLAVNLDLISPSNTSFISSRFMESNLFLSTSNGDSLANFDELHNLLGHIYSGLARANLLKKKITARCNSSRSIKAYSALVSIPCLFDIYYKESQAFSGLPKFLEIKDYIAEEDIKDYYLNLLFATGHSAGTAMASMEHIDLMPHVIQYVEMVFATYDANNNQMLEKDEALRAFPVYKQIIKELTVDYNIKEDELPGVFIYLLKNGRGPKTIPEKLAFLNFIKNPNKWDIQTTRLELGKIFRFIAESKK